MSNAVLSPAFPAEAPPAVIREFSACLGELRGELNAILSGIRKSPAARDNEKAAVMAALLDSIGELQAVKEEADAAASGSAPSPDVKVAEFLASTRLTLEKARDLSETVPGIAREADPFIKQAFHLLSAVHGISMNCILFR